MMIALRLPRRDDAGIFRLIRRELVPITRQAFPDVAFDRKTTLERLKQATTYVMLRSGKVIGFVSVVLRKDDAFIDMLAVDGTAQSRGYGSQLMERAEQEAVKHGCRTAWLYVDGHNGKAKRFYAGRGYRHEQHIREIRCDMLRKSLVQEPPIYPPFAAGYGWFG